MQYTIEKPYKMVRKNCKKNLKFWTFIRFLGPFLKKMVILNFWMDEDFWVKLSANLPHWVAGTTYTTWVGMATILCLSRPFFKSTTFSKMTLKISQKLKVENFKIFFCIFCNHFIGLLYGILHVLILWVYPEKSKENYLLLNTFCTPL